MSEVFNIAHEIWSKKYKYPGSPTVPEDRDFGDTARRIALALSKDEKDKDKWYKEFYDIIREKKFLPGGRIMSNAGTSRSQTTMFNCFVMNTIEDSMEGIFKSITDSAMTQKQGGGVGFDFSTIRPNKSNVQGCEAEASGPISFMKIYDASARTIASAGNRRSAQLAALRCDHPDIEEFIDAKRENGQLQMFNLSVAITDKFMDAVKKNKDWDLIFNGKVYKTISAKYLWDKITKSTYEWAEPGVLFIDTINKMNNLNFAEYIATTNPCGEQSLPPYGACLLGSVNLTKFVIDPFTTKATFDFSAFEKTIAIATRMLDNVIDMSNFPLEEQKKEALSKRRMGIGITGLADALVMLNLKYNSDEGRYKVRCIMQNLAILTYTTSAKLAEEKGCCPFLKDKETRELYLESNYFKNIFNYEHNGKSFEIFKKNVMEYGIRNTHLTSIAPTGTISMVAGNVSSGLEPIFALRYDRKIRVGQTNDDTITKEVRDYAYDLFKKTFGNDVVLPDTFVTTDDLTPEDHIKMMEVVQTYIDSACSKTINVPVDISFEDFQDVYMQAYEANLKGCTTFRPSDNLTGILIKKDDKKKEIEVKIPLIEEKKEDVIASRPKELTGATYKIKPGEGAAYYITINDYLYEDGSIRPFELFINTKNVNGFSWIVAVSRLLSSVLRMSKDPMFIADELSNVHDPNGGYWADGGYIPSVPAEIGIILKKHINRNKLAIDPIGKAPDAPITSENDTIKGVEQVTKNKGTLCPNCGTYNYVKVDGCAKCLNCDYSKCG